MMLRCQFSVDGLVYERDVHLDVREILACVNPMLPLVEACRTIYHETRRVASSMEMTDSEWAAIRRSAWWPNFVKYAGGREGDDAEPKTLAYALGIPRVYIREDKG